MVHGACEAVHGRRIRAMQSNMMSKPLYPEGALIRHGRLEVARHPVAVHVDPQLARGRVGRAARAAVAEPHRRGMRVVRVVRVRLRLRDVLVERPDEQVVETIAQRKGLKAGKGRKNVKSARCRPTLSADGTRQHPAPT